MTVPYITEDTTADEILAMRPDDLERYASDALDVALETVCVEFVNVMRRVAEQAELTVQRSRRGGVFAPGAEQALARVNNAVQRALSLQEAVGRIDQVRRANLERERASRQTPEGQATAYLDRLDHEDDDHRRADLLEGLFRLEDAYGEPVSKLVRAAGLPSSVATPSPPCTEFTVAPKREVEGLER